MLFKVSQSLAVVLLLAQLPAYDDPQSIWYAARRGDLATVKAKLSENPQLIDAKDKDQRTALLYAAKAGHHRVVDYLLTEGSKSAHSIDAWGHTAVHWAVMYAKTEVVKVFAKRGVDLNQPDRSGRAPIHCAVGNAYSNTPDHKEVVKLLLSLKVDVNAQDKKGMSVLHCGAMLTGKVDCVRELLTYGEGIKVDLRDKNGGTALHMAAAFGRTSVAKLLMEHGANPELPDASGKTPIDRAQECSIDVRRDAIVRVVGGDKAVQPGRRVDKSKAFSYRLPKAWKVVDVQRHRHDVFILPGGNSKRGNIVVTRHEGEESLEVLKELYEKRLPARLRNFQLIASGIGQPLNGRRAVYMNYTCTIRGIKVQRKSYLIGVKDKRYFITYTVPPDDMDNLDRSVSEFVQSISAP